MKILLIGAAAGLLAFGAAAQEGASPTGDVVILETKLQGVFGGIRDGQLIDAKTASISLGSNKSFLRYGPLDKTGTKYSIESTDSPELPCEEFFGYRSRSEAGTGIAFGANLNWNPVPRKVVAISTKSPVYRDIVRKYLRTKGITRPVVKIKESYRTDLEGDGRDEVVILAENYSDFGPAARKGEYSFLMVRKIVGKSVRNILITGDFYKEAIEFGAPNRLEISGILDLDGDGILEIVVYGQYYEGVWAEAYRLEAAKPKVVLQTGCGV
ncbi:MAG: hypothetical protein OEM82_08840 [Acidobacteriota bacterium]|nr:hypothetical protein [Acidobacteriota bacterium]MDH3528796.1 hypothetical protein [Acidobacteriota bacterium]